ncbi:MAG: ATP-grasp fold amidoligase family protein [Bacilli bacterium]
MHRILNLRNPKTYNEKLQWLKLHDRKELYTTLVDKSAVKEYVTKKIGKEYVIPNIGIWENVQDIDYSLFPQKFVIKCTHNSGTGMYICKNKEVANFEEINKRLEIGLKEDYYKYLREWPYKNVPHKIIAEEYIENNADESLNDYKVLCFNGVPKLIQLNMGRFTDKQTQDYYDIDWNKTNITQNCCSGFGASQKLTPKPKNLDRMLELSSILSKDIPCLRVDWYSIEDKLYFGEMTFFDGSGLDGFDDYNDDSLLGSWIDLSLVKQEAK